MDFSSALPHALNFPKMPYWPAQYQALKALLDELLKNPLQAEAEAQWILDHWFEISPSRLWSHGETLPVTDKAFETLKSIVTQRVSQRMPLQHLTGYTEFYGHRLVVSPDVLIPRPETEELVERAWKDIQYRLDCLLALPQRVGQHAYTIHLLDLGLGSGCILLSLMALIHESLSQHPNGNVVHVSGIGVDISTRALQVAQQNAVALGWETTRTSHSQAADTEEQPVHLTVSPWLWAERVAGPHTVSLSFYAGDWWAALPAETAGFDVIVSNPPYIDPADHLPLAPEVQQHEPHLALFAPLGEPDYFYTQTLAGLSTHLVHSPQNSGQLPGSLYLEMDPAQSQRLLPELETFIARHPTCPERVAFVAQDYSGRDRFCGFSPVESIAK